METEENEITHDQLWLIAQGHSAFQLLWAGVDMDVFESIEEKEPNFNDLREVLGLEENAAKILINGLLSLKFITRSGDNFRNSKITKEYLLKRSPVNLIKMLGWQRHIVYPGVVDFIESLKTNDNIGLRHFPGEGETLYKRLSTDPEIEKVFQDAMESLSTSSNYYLLENLDLKNQSHMVDFGGGNGTNGIAFHKRNPHLKVTVLDSPSVIEKAKANIISQKVEDKVGTLAGDFFSTPFPEGTDCVLYSHIVTIWSPERNIELLKRIYDALPSGGKVFVFSALGNNNGDGPVSTAVGSVYFQAVATGEGMLYSKDEVVNFVRKAGFESELQEGLPVDHSLVIGTK